MAPADARPDRRDAILDAAAGLFAAKGVAVTTVRDIGEAAGILSGSLYHHFDSKESMVAEIVSEYLDELVASYDAVLAAADDPRRCMERLMAVTFDAVERHPAACAIYQNEFNYLRSLPSLSDIDAVATRIRDVWVGVVQAGAASGAFRPDIDPDVFYRLAGHAVLSAVRWYTPTGDYPVEALVGDAITILLDGFALER